MQKSKAKKEKNNNNRQLLPWNLSVFNSPQLSVRFNVQDGGIALFLLKKVPSSVLQNTPLQASPEVQHLPPGGGPSFLIVG